MIALQRERIKDAVPGGLRGHHRKNKELKLLKERREILAGRLNKHDFKSTYWKPAKAQLKKETHLKCAYCEARVGVVAHGDVEHYRPKSIYWWLAYSYENYLFSCQICNQIYKGSKFPISGNRLPTPEVQIDMSDDDLKEIAGQLTTDILEETKGMSYQHFADLVEAENADLPNPYEIDPETLFTWEADDHLKEVRLMSNCGNAESERYVQAVENDYGLNRTELLRERYHIFRRFRAFKQVLQFEGLPDSIKEETALMVESMKTAEQPFPGMIRYFDKLWDNEPIMN